MYIKKFVCSLLAFMMLFTCILSSVISFADDNIFNFTELDDGYNVTLKSNYLDLLNDQKELIIPESYMSKSVTSAGALGVTTSDSKIESIVYPSGVASSVLRQFRFFSVLTSVSWKSSTLNLNANTFRDCSSTLTSIYIYATSLTVSDSAFRTINSNANAKIYVTSEAIKNQIVTATAGGSYPVQASQIEVMQATKPTASVTISCANIAYGTEGGFKPSAVVKVGEEIIANPTVTYQLYSDEACNNAYNGYPYNSASLPIGAYYMRATVAGTDDYTGSASNVVKVEVTKNTITDPVKEKLDAAIKSAEDFKDESVESDYDTSAWNAVYAANTGDLAEAKRIADNIESGRYTEAQVTAAAENLEKALETLKTSVIDPAEAKERLNEVIEEAEGIDAGKYTDESYQKLVDEIEKAKQTIANNEATKTKVENAITALEEKIKSLEIKQDIIVPAGNPFVKVYSAGKTEKPAEILNVNADESMNGASKVRITFDCAEDVSFNPNASLEVESLVAGKKSYQKVQGTDGSYTAGKKDFTLDFPLNAVVKKGDSVKLSAFTYSWADAKDYVYGITKLEFMNEEGKIIKAYNDVIVAQENLEKAIKEAETLDANKYTAESFKAVTAAIEAAKKLGEDASAEAKNEAAAAIEAAVKALVIKPTEQPSKPDSSKQNPTVKPSVSAKATRNAELVKKERAAAKKAMKQAKITKLKVKSKAKKKINVSWKKVKKAKGYQVQVSAKKNFKKVIFKKDLKKTKLTIKNKKIKSKKKYFVRVRAYATYKDKNNKTVKVYSKWNKKLRKVSVK